VSVYVDPQMTCLVSRAWRWPTSCHMFSDSLDELHAFAARIGLRRAWFQDGRFPHYDLNEWRRRMAVKAGVVELDRRAAVEMWRAKGWSRRRTTETEAHPC
jgi:hypothetical protein